MARSFEGERLLARVLVAACTATALAGCASSSLDLAAPHANRPWVPKTSAEGEIRAKPTTETGESFVLPANHRLAALTPPPEVDAGHAYTLPELIDIAQSNNPLTQVAWYAARDAALAVGLARSTYLPRLSAAAVGGFQGSTGDSTTRAAVPGLGSPDTSSTTHGTFTGAITTLGLQWLLFDFGERGARVDAAEQVSVASNVLFTGVHQQVAYAVTVAFYQHAAAAQRVAMVEKALANARDVQAAAELRLKQGQATVVDVAQARQSTAQAELRSVQAKGSAQSAHYELLGAMGISPMTKLHVADVSRQKMSTSLVELTEKTIEDAVSRRPDVLAAYAQVKAADANVSATRASFFPKIFMSGNVAYSTGDLSITAIPEVGQEAATVNLSGTRFSGTVIGGISVPIYDGGTRDALHRQSKNRVASANASLKQAREQSVRQIVVTDNALRTSLALLASASTLAEAAATTFEAAFEAYRSGAGSVTVATMAESGLLDARIAETDAYSAVQIAAATLALAMGSAVGPR